MYVDIEISRKAKLLAGVFNALGLKIDISKFPKRLRIQKIVYMLQLHPEFKKYLNFNFNIYLRGPYSPELAEAYYNLPDKREIPEIHLSREALEYGKEIANIKSDDLEIMATLIEAIKINKGSINDDELVELVSNLKPWHSREKIASTLKKAYTLAKKHNIKLG